MADFVGLFGGILLALSGVPQALSAIRRGNVVGVSLHTMLLVVSGLSLMGTYIFLKHGFDLILHAQNALSIGVWLVCLRYHFFPRIDGGNNG